MRTLISLATLVLIAGSATAQQPNQTGEPNTYRYGGTYKILSTGSAASCALFCGKEDTCLAWSFQRSTQGLGGAKCELKSTIGRSVRNPLMTSGINPHIASAGQETQRRIPSVDTLLGAPVTAQPRNVIRSGAVRSIPATPPPLAPTRKITPPPQRVTPTPAPTQQATPPTPKPAPITYSKPLPGASPAAPVSQAAPTPAPIVSETSSSREQVNPPTTQPELPSAAIVPTAPPPQISFTPQTPSQTDSVTIPTKTNTPRDASRQLDTVPAGTVPPQQATSATPYNRLRNRKYPDFSINSGTALTPEELAQQDALARTTIERVDIDSVDLATDIGEPINPNRTVGGHPQTGGGS